MKPKMEAKIAMMPKNDIWACPKLSIKIRKEPENIPTMDPIKPIAISKVLERVLVRFMIIYMGRHIIYKLQVHNGLELKMASFFNIHPVKGDCLYFTFTFMPIPIYGFPFDLCF